MKEEGKKKVYDGGPERKRGTLFVMNSKAPLSSSISTEYGEDVQSKNGGGGDAGNEVWDRLYIKGKAKMQKKKEIDPRQRRVSFDANECTFRPTLATGR